MLSVLLAALMCASMLALCASAGVVKRDAGGSVIIGGNDNAKVNVEYIAAAPTMDGVITTEEWGEPIAHVVVGMARKNYNYDDDNNVLVSEYCYLCLGRLKYVNPLNFDLFLSDRRITRAADVFWLSHKKYLTDSHFLV